MLSDLLSDQWSVEVELMHESEGVGVSPCRGEGFSLGNELLVDLSNNCGLFVVHWNSVEDISLVR